MCANCPYRENCKLGLYAINPCDCEIEIYRDMVNVFAPVVYKYQNPFTGKFESSPVPEDKIRNPFLY